MALTPKQSAFCEEYLVDLNGTQAAIRAGYSARTANVKAAQLLTHAEIQARIQELMAARSKRLEVTQDQVLEKLWAIASADPNDLVEFRRRCCRYCYGKGFGYQETRAERDRRRRAWQAELAKAQEKDAGVLVEPFEELGGLGWDPRRDPNPKCPECFGEGQGEVIIKDTGRAALEARALYAGVKVTRDGVEVKMNDQVGTLLHVGRHLGMFVDRKRLEDPDGNAVPITRIQLVGIRPAAVSGDDDDDDDGDA